MNQEAIKNKRVLLVEDEAEIRQLIELHLLRQGYEVREVEDGQSAMKCLETENFDVLIFDWMLPDISGIDLTRWVRARNQTAKMPLLMVTAKSEPEDVVRGIEAGADDYITKPFDYRVLMARVASQIRRRQWEKTESNPDAIVFRDLTIFPKQYEVRRDGEKLELTKSEFTLLLALVQNSGRVLTRKQLAELLAGDTLVAVGRAVDTHIFTLRKKLGLSSELVETVRGIGYRVRLGDTH